MSGETARSDGHTFDNFKGDAAGPVSVCDNRWAAPTLKLTMYAMTDNRKLSEIRQLGNRVTRGFQRLGLEQRRAVVERLDTVTAETLKKAVLATNKHECSRMKNGDTKEL